MKFYTIGVATTSTKVVLIKKTKPAWQAGKLNFVGGKVEGAESDARCVAREFHEETGVFTNTESWNYIGRMVRPSGPDAFYCAIFAMEDEVFNFCRTVTEEEIILMSKFEFEHPSDSPYQFMSNVKFIYDFTKLEDYRKYGCKLEINFPSTGI